MSGRRTLDEAIVAVRDVDGWMSADQAAELFRAAATTEPGDVVVEIGSFRGRSTIVLASAVPDGVEVVAIDPHAGNDRGPQELQGFDVEAADDHAVFTRNLREAGVADRVRHVRAFSDRAHGEVAGEIAVLYVDGAHRYRPALADIRSWGRRVRPGGAMLVHDSFSSIGVTLAIVRSLVFGRRFRYVGRARSLAVYRADLDPSITRRLVNALRQLAQLPWFAKSLMVKALISARVLRHREWPY